MPKDTELHKAAGKGNINAVEDILDSGKDVNCRGAQNRTPLHKAVGGGHVEVAMVLLERRADIYATDKSGLTPIHWAARYGYEDMGFGLLETKDPPINAQSRSGDTALHLAGESGHIEFCKLLIENGADANIKNKQQQTPYDVAKLKKTPNHKETVKYLKLHTEGVQKCCILM